MLADKNSCPRELLLHLYRTAVASASAERCLPAHLNAISHRKIHVVGGGKAAAAMANVIEDHYSGKISGIVVTRYGHSVDCSSIEVVEAAHPIPDRAGLAAAQKIFNSTSALDSSTLVVCVISGGASALLSLPHEQVSLEHKRSITRQLLLAGAGIHQINCVRKHLSAVKGGRLMQNIHPNSALTLCISDVVGDDPSTIGSGPTVPDTTTCNDVLDVLMDYEIETPAKILDLLKSGDLETPKPGSSIFQESNVEIIAKASDCLNASAAAAQEAGIEAIVLGDSVEGDTALAARNHASFIRELISENPNRNPFAVLSGGETTVTVTGQGKGGPNTHFALALAVELENLDCVHAIACDTDGIDGTADNAGAIVDPTTLKRAREKNLNAHEFLKNNDSYGFFKQIGNLVTTGPTLTNVNDFRAIYVEPGKN